VIRTRVGYSGGTLKAPTYHHLGDHTESIQIEFDTSVISFDKMLNKFWESHDPSYERDTQYMSIIFYHSPEQKKAAEASKAEYDKAHRTPASTVIRPASDFYLAEGYHQKFYLRQHSDIVKDLKLSDTELTHSAAATRLNSYVSGFGSSEQLAKEIGDFKLSAPVQEKVKAIVNKGKRRFCA